MAEIHKITAIDGDEIEVRLPKDCCYSVGRTGDGVVLKVKLMSGELMEVKPNNYNYALDDVDAGAIPSRDKGIEVHHMSQMED